MEDLIKHIYSKKHLTTKSKLAEFFVDLEARDVLKTKDNMIYADGIKTKTMKTFPCLEKYNVDGIPAYAKASSIFSVFGMASSKMYNDLGIASPITCPMDGHPDTSYLYKTLSQDVEELKRLGLNVKQAIEHPELVALSPPASGKWSALYNENEKELLLQYMTEECFDELTTIFLLDEIRTDTDRHKANYFLIKPKGAKKYTNIVPIDLEQSQLLSIADDPYFGETSRKASFERFLNSKYLARAYFPFADEQTSYEERLDNIKKLIHDGKLKPHQIEVIKNALEYNFPKAILDLKRYGCYIDYQVNTNYDSFSYLWEFSRNHLGRELGL